jgi:hypothetical protein
MTKADEFRIGAAICKIKRDLKHRLHEAVRVAYRPEKLESQRLPIPHRSSF